ncbi:hypothetical protein [Pseudogracilibacillus sp. SO30301A]|uniref:hypothetical protein n=1 Tax=Pseudogracilibacillus sp. SO30301A TaxID=3098291 RepID=UPI00300E2818
MAAFINDPSEWKVFEQTHPAIIEESVFLIAQKIRRSRRRPNRYGDMGLFTGLLFCADCGGKMYLCRASGLKRNKSILLVPPIEKIVPFAIKRIVFERWC